MFQRSITRIVFRCQIKDTVNVLKLTQEISVNPETLWTFWRWRSIKVNSKLAWFKSELGNSELTTVQNFDEPGDLLLSVNTNQFCLEALVNRIFRNARY